MWKAKKNRVILPDNFDNSIYYSLCLYCVPSAYQGFPGSSDGKKVYLQCRRPQLDSWVGKIGWRRDRCGCKEDPALRAASAPHPFTPARPCACVSFPVQTLLFLRPDVPLLPACSREDTTFSWVMAPPLPVLWLPAQRWSRGDVPCPSRRPSPHCPSLGGELKGSCCSFFRPVSSSPVQAPGGEEQTVDTEVKETGHPGWDPCSVLLSL